MEKFRKVLLIDEDPISTYLHTKLIKKVGFAEETVTAANGREACEMLLRDCTGIGNACPDLIFVNAYMKHMDGFEFMEEYSCLKIASSAKIVLLSFDIDAKENEKIERFEGVTLVNRPLTAEALEHIRQETLSSLS